MIETALRHALMTARAFQWPWTAPRSSKTVRARQSHGVAFGCGGRIEEALGPPLPPEIEPIPPPLRARVGRI